jgi:hypothetical protein
VEWFEAVQLAQLIVTVVLVPPVWIVFKMVTNHMRHDLAEIKGSIDRLPCQEKKCSVGSGVR